MRTGLEDQESRADAELIASVRAGGTDGYAALYERHAGAARRLARQLARSDAHADDLVSEAFARVLAALRLDNGPTEAFRAYLLTTLRNLAHGQRAADRRLELSDDLEALVPVAPPADPVIADADRTLIARAFAQLPERWRVVLWHVEVEGESPCACWSRRVCSARTRPRTSVIAPSTNS